MIKADGSVHCPNCKKGGHSDLTVLKVVPGGYSCGNCSKVWMLQLDGSYSYDDSTHTENYNPKAEAFKQFTVTTKAPLKPYVTLVTVNGKVHRVEVQARSDGECELYKRLIAKFIENGLTDSPVDSPAVSWRIL